MEPPTQAHDGQRGVGEAGEVSGKRASVYPGEVLVAGEVANIVEAVLDLPVAPVQGEKSTRFRQLSLDKAGD